ncbi:SDR family oxidoreductase [Alicyclobacillus macrosporangiidus]|uniref:Gluconate 5-dehydrogenase n=1 Tax=Alicyclobacillus macrosporangiidus TaxID=392015 RepID=A0A1I7GYB0_9BACL|nr:SDR family oxidoreductase [Alicyclobacillus macrosporangiidus]SFU53421.1 gluconate 5-dehydrogenase [Alicyclobacillus macrosporangiidus]
MSVLDLFRLDGKVAIVTGGGRGLGRQIAQAYAEVGAKLVLCSRRVENCEQVKAEVEAMGAEAVALPLDLTDPASVQRVADETVARFGRIDILVNNGGASWGAPALEMPYEAWMKVIQTNLTGTFLMSQAAARHMKEQGGGKIINIASVAGLGGTAPEVLDAVGYNASKGGVITLTKDLAVKWARYGIYVNAIAPGFFPTKMTKAVLEKSGDLIRRATPLGRVGGPRDLQGAALYFASAASDYTTGQVLAVDGGQSAG